MPSPPTAEEIRKIVSLAESVLLRWETEFTPCTGITAVSKQERRYFRRAVTVAPWCPMLERESHSPDPLQTGAVLDTGVEFQVNGVRCQVLASNDDLPPVIMLDVEGRFRGRKSPYDTPGEPPRNDPESTLRHDSLVFGLAVEALLAWANAPRAFIWGADWQTVPALLRLRDRHHVALTLHNTYDECLAAEAAEFGEVYAALCRRRSNAGERDEHVTALEVGLSQVDVATTVNRGFAWGIRHEPLQRDLMARHLKHLLHRVIGIDNAAFRPPSPCLMRLRDTLRTDFPAGCEALFAQQAHALSALPRDVREKATGKAIVVAMGRRVSQKQHDVVVESLRQILTEDPKCPVLVLFLTTYGDAGSPARLARIQALAAEFPAHVIVTDGLLPNYATFLEAAHFNCLASLFEPHGAAYEGTVVPVARAVDGLASQICGLRPRGEAARINDLWHRSGEPPSGILFREDPTTDAAAPEWLGALLTTSPSPGNPLFRAITAALSDALREAVALWLRQKDEYARLVLAALERQSDSSWEANLGGMLALIEEARIRRPL